MLKLKTVLDPRFHEIPRERIADRVAQELLRMIAAGDLVPGERLPGERRLAEMMNVSRVTVRSALQHLKSRGFIAAVQGGGTRILAADAKNSASALTRLVQVDRKNLKDLAEIRAGLEVWAARHAAERGTDEQLAEIADTLAIMNRPGRAERFKAQDDQRLHLAIGKASGSAVYMHLMSMLSDILEEMFAYHRYTLFIGPSEDRLIAKKHREIVEAIQARDGNMAARAMAEHLQTVLTMYRSVQEAPTPSESINAS